jgi:hypothetical protein
MNNDIKIQINTIAFAKSFFTPFVHNADELVKLMTTDKNITKFKTLGELASLIDYIDNETCANFNDVANEFELAEESISFDDSDKRKIDWL